MQKLLIKGKKKLSGTISISGSKNASLPILASTILTSKKVFLKNVPMLKDVETMLSLLKSLGSKISINKKKNEVIILNNKKLKTTASYNLLKTMRAGVLVLGPLLAKFYKAKVSLPGGCAIGSRPVDIHLNALKKMGAIIEIKDGYIFAKAPKGLKGAKIVFPKISVGATENILIAACFAKGKTIMKNCACEPEIKDLSNFLIKSGCKIRWTGKRSIEIFGINELQSTVYKIIFDRIEAGTYSIAAALTGGNIIIKNISPKIIKTELNILKKMGVKIKKSVNQIQIIDNSNLKKINLTTSPYSGFPTDLQAQMMVLMCKSKGTSTIKENIFENRFMHVSELKRIGADIKIEGNKATIYGGASFNGAELMATDLRASVSLVLAGLVASKTTIINRIYHLDRGYEKLESKLSKCGASIKRLKNG